MYFSLSSLLLSFSFRPLLTEKPEPHVTLVPPTNDFRYTFGWTRAEVLGALVNATFLLAMCLSIFMSAIARFVEVEVR